MKCPSMRQMAARRLSETPDVSFHVTPDNEGQQYSSLCNVMEGFMNAMFTPPDHLYHENSIVEQPLSTKQLDEHPLDEHPLDEHHLDEQQLDEQQRVKPPPSPRSVCRMWKNKRRQQRQRAMELKLMDTNISSDGSLQSELKQSALKVQKVYEDSPEDDDDAYRYEKYGSRAEFAQSRKPHRIRIVV